MPAIALAGAALALSAHQGEQAAESRRKQEQVQRGQQEKQDKLYAEAEQKESEQVETDKVETDRSKIRSRQKRLASNASGRSSTLLTGPLGVTGDSAGGQKSLLGQ